MTNAIVAFIGESYFVLICEDPFDLYLGIAECSDQEQAVRICEALNDRYAAVERLISYGGSE
jgi:hypothetical protein